MNYDSLDAAGKIRAQLDATRQARSFSKATETPYVDGYEAGLSLALKIVAGSVVGYQGEQ